jgi:hypothetical protein
MDFSEKYINMCAKAQEIQDYYFDTDDMRPNLPAFVCSSKMQRVCIQIWAPETLRQDLGIENPTLVISVEWQNDGNIKLPESQEPYKPIATWLPRQDQLQHFVLERKKDLYNDLWVFLKDFEVFVQITRYRNNESFEQRWLEFTMGICFGKEWDDTEWKQM